VARLLGVASESGYYDSQGYTQLGPHPTAVDIAAGDQITALARAAEGPVFSEEAAFMFRAGKPVVTNPFPQLVMFQAGLFDPANEIAMIERQAFGLVILRAQFYPPPVLAALGAHYVPLTEITMNGFLYRLLAPRPTAGGTP
jgi:predicted Na+-dependent transporter